MREKALAPTFNTHKNLTPPIVLNQSKKSSINNKQKYLLMIKVFYSLIHDFIQIPALKTGVI